VIDIPDAALTGALILPEPARAEVWRRWRAAQDIDALSYECQQLLPAFAACLPRWLDGDAAAARIQGIVRMVWSRNQVRLHKAAELQQALLRASATPVVIVGPLAWSLLTREEGSIRSIPNLTLLIPREDVSKAASALVQDGWQLCGDLPDSAAMDWSCYLPLTKGDETLHLHWRLSPAPEGEAIASERAVMERLRTVTWNRHTFQVLSPEADLLHRLTDRPSWDPVPWQADVLMTPFSEIDWPRFRELASRFAPVIEPVDVFRRLMKLRSDWQLPIPHIAPIRRRPPVGAMARAYVNRLRFVQLGRRLSRRGRLLWRS
jgi:hypothetical protein